MDACVSSRCKLVIPFRWLVSLERIPGKCTGSCKIADLVSMLLMKELEMTIRTVGNVHTQLDLIVSVGIKI